jgi:hypothetical protein
MAKEFMYRAAADNAYLHRDFHGALSVGIDYLDQTLGAAAVKDYLFEFARTFYAPLTSELKRRGLSALRDHYRRVFQLEGGQVDFTESLDELIVDVSESPAVHHMRRQGYPVARLFHETIQSVGAGICEGTEYESELMLYHEASGGYRQRFFRSPSR